jgi:hypothetical protein
MQSRLAAFVGAVLALVAIQGAFAQAPAKPALAIAQPKVSPAATEGAAQRARKRLRTNPYGAVSGGSPKIRCTIQFMPLRAHPRCLWGQFRRGVPSCIHDRKTASIAPA